MVGILIKQPNEKYCILNYCGDVVRYNLTEQDIIDIYIKDAKASIGAAKHYGELITQINGGDDNVLKEMGFDKPYNELIKFVPRKPIHQHYASCDFATYGNCPNCGESVRDGMGGTDNKCRKCGQMLRW